MAESTTGVWLVGAVGSLATTTIAGARILSRGLSSVSGLLTETDDFASLELVPVGNLVFGGHEIRTGTVAEGAETICEQNGSLKKTWLDQLGTDLGDVDARIRPGVARGGGAAIEGMGDREAKPATLRASVETLQADLEAFRAEQGVDRLVVVNLASTEPPTALEGPYADLAALERALDADAPGALRPGLLYSYAAFRAGAAYLNFTPSNSCLCPAVQQLAAKAGLPFMGNDGKTGETLVKSALAPMFSYRNLPVDSWVGYNVLGNRDGEVLDVSENKSSKLASKDQLLSTILGYPLNTRVGIDYVKSLGDHKVAWDFIHFRGFMDFPMSMQFTWQGCDSILAAPLVLDLVRFADLALKRGETGALQHLAAYFKSPVDCDEHNLHRQFQLLRSYAEAAG